MFLRGTVFDTASWTAVQTVPTTSRCGSAFSRNKNVIYTTMNGKLETIVVTSRYSPGYAVLNQIKEHVNKLDQATEENNEAEKNIVPDSFYSSVHADTVLSRIVESFSEEEVYKCISN